MLSQLHVLDNLAHTHVCVGQADFRAAYKLSGVATVPSLLATAGQSASSNGTTISRHIAPALTQMLQKEVQAIHDLSSSLALKLHVISEQQQHPRSASCTHLHGVDNRQEAACTGPLKPPSDPDCARKMSISKRHEDMTSKHQQHGQFPCTKLSPTTRSSKRGVRSTQRPVLQSKALQPNRNQPRPDCPPCVSQDPKVSMTRPTTKQARPRPQSRPKPVAEADKAQAGASKMQRPVQRSERQHVAVIPAGRSHEPCRQVFPSPRSLTAKDIVAANNCILAECNAACQADFQHQEVPAASAVDASRSQLSYALSPPDRPAHDMEQHATNRIKQTRERSGMPAQPAMNGPAPISQQHCMSSGTAAARSASRSRSSGATSISQAFGAATNDSVSFGSMQPSSSYDPRVAKLLLEVDASSLSGSAPSVTVWLQENQSPQSDALPTPAGSSAKSAHRLKQNQSPSRPQQCATSACVSSQESAHSSDRGQSATDQTLVEMAFAGGVNGTGRVDPIRFGQKGLRRSAERAAQVFEANAAVMAAADRDNTSAGPASAAYKPAPVERAAQVFAANAAAMAAADCVNASAAPASDAHEPASGPTSQSVLPDESYRSAQQASRAFAANAAAAAAAAAANAVADDMRLTAAMPSAALLQDFCNPSNDGGNSADRDDSNLKAAQGHQSMALAVQGSGMASGSNQKDRASAMHEQARSDLDPVEFGASGSSETDSPGELFFGHFLVASEEG